MIGVNDRTSTLLRQVVSNASCTTNCLVPMVKVVDVIFGFRQGLMTTVHAYTNDQELLDLGRDDLRRCPDRSRQLSSRPPRVRLGRRAGARFDEGPLRRHPLRVPVVDGSITDLTAVVGAAVTAGDVNEAFLAAASDGPLARVIEYSEDQIVSSDIVGRDASCIFDSTLTMAIPLDDSSTLVEDPRLV